MGAAEGGAGVSSEAPLLVLDAGAGVRVSTHSLAGGRAESLGKSRGAGGRTRGSAGARKFRKRVVLKNGDCNVVQTNISKRRLRYLQDIFTTLVDVQWRWTLLVFALSFILSWLAFAVLWWLIAFSHGDLEPGDSSDGRPCVVELHDFASCFLFSVETQHTIGYGSRSTTEECPEAIFVMCLQSITGVMIQAFMVGIVFAKMSRPKNRTQTLLFSRNAVVCQRDGHLCLMFRVGDMRKSHIIGARVRAQLIRSRVTKEGETLSMYQHELAVGADSDRDDLFFIWPMTVVHRIDEQSPLYDLSAAELLRDRFEIVVMLEGCIESTGQTTQARSSYLPGEILWGHRFQPIVSFNRARAGYEVDYSVFNDTYEVDTPLCSAKALAEFYRIQEELRRSGRRLNQDTSNFYSASFGADSLNSRDLVLPCQKNSKTNSPSHLNYFNLLPNPSMNFMNEIQQQDKLNHKKQIALESPEMPSVSSSSPTPALNIPPRNDTMHCVISFGE